MTKRRVSAASAQPPNEPAATALFGDVLRRFRRAAQFTQEELAERATLSPRAISDLERGERRWPQRETVKLLAEALDLSPTDRAALEAAARGRDNAMSARKRITTPHNLPAAVTPIVGRERELADLPGLLHRVDVRIVTITGPGGVGKSRLAHAVAAEVLDQFPDGVFFVSLAPLRDAEDVATTIAQTLGVEDRGGGSLWDSLLTRLRDQRVLLVLDNFEHVLDEAMLVANLAAYCERLTVLVTSREILRLRGEYEYAVAPLALPDAATADTSAIVANPAVALFCQRAEAARHDFTLTDENAVPIAHICARLGGLPLAIELAAARIRVFPPSGLLARLATLLPELTGGTRDAPERHRTLRATIAWSDQLLDDAERRLFYRFTAFAGGWTQDAAVAICPEERATDARLTSLVEKHLVSVDAESDGEPRYVMLELIREYGWERLMACGDAIETQRLHAVYFASLAERAEPELRGPEQRTWLARLEAEHDNLRVALRWTREHHEAEIGLRLASALWRFWQGHGHLHEASTWLEAMLTLDRGLGERTPPTIRAKALNAAGAVAYRSGDQALAARRFAESLAIRRALDQPTGVANALNNLGLVAYEQGALTRSRELYEESLAVWRTLGQERGIAMALENLAGVLGEQGNFPQAMAMKEESLAIKERLGDTWGIALTVSNMANIAIAAGDFPRAAAFAERSLALQETLGDRWGIAVSLGYLGLIALHRGEYERARMLEEEALAIRRDLGDGRGIAIALRHLAQIFHACGDHATAHGHLTESLSLFWQNAATMCVIFCLEDVGQIACGLAECERAACFLGAADALRAAHGIVLSRADIPQHEHAVATTRAALGDAAFASAWAAGAATALADLVTEATGSATLGMETHEGRVGNPSPA